MDQSQAPLWEALLAYAKKEVVSFHTPGHKRGSGVFSILSEVLGETLFALDSSDEIECRASNNQFEDVLAQAQSLAASAFHSQATRFLVNGTTGGIHCMLLSLKGEVILPRFSHQSVYASLILSEVSPVYLETVFDTEWFIALPPSLAEVKTKLGGCTHQTIFLTNPTYYGTTPDPAITAFARENGVMVFVDEAHGGHFAFSNSLPKSGLELGADLVVHSTHKLLGSLTQSSMLHIGNACLIPEQDRALSVLQTTSPSLVMLAVLDVVRRELYNNGVNLVERALGLSVQLRIALQRIKGVSVLPSYLQQDPTKVIFNFLDLGLTGIQVEHLLRKDYNIQVELSDYHNVLALLTLGDSLESVQRLSCAIKDLAERYANCASLPKSNLPPYPGLPKATIGLKEAYHAKHQVVSLDCCVGRVCGQFITPYPPGVPLTVPGEVITADVIDFIIRCKKLGWYVRGVHAEKVTVIKE